MTRTRARPVLSHAAALLAVVLLTLAGVRAGVMQAAAASPAAKACLDGTGLGATHAPGKAMAHAGCEFCVAASVAPLASAAPVLPVPSVVAYAFPAARGGLGPRGPPAVQPRARGPPPLLTA